MVFKIIRENKGKSLLIAGIVLMWVLLLVLFKNYGYEETWQLWGVPTEMPPFLDFRQIPGAAESFRNGFEPSIVNPFDPAQRLFNYPAIWRLLFYTNISQNDTVWMVSLMIILFFIGVILFPKVLSISGAFWMLLIVFSPASMLLYERGNIDLFVFFICVIAILAMDYSVYFAGIAIVFGAVVKIFPIFGITMFLREPKRKFGLLIFACIALMLVYSLITIESQSAIWNTTPKGEDVSYGTFVIVARYASYIYPDSPALNWLNQWKIIFEVFAFMLIFSATSFAVRDSRSLLADNERNLNAFRVGASIYVGTFLFGNNWDYRLAFLVFVVPQLSQWLYTKVRRHQIAAISVMIGLVLSSWYLLLNHSFFFDEAINWMLVPGFTYLLCVSSPSWFKQNVQKIFGVSKMWMI